MLLTISDITELMGGEPLSRMADAIEIFERLLRDAGLSTQRSLELQKRYPARVQDCYAKVRRSVTNSAGAQPS